MYDYTQLEEEASNPTQSSQYTFTEDSNTEAMESSYTASEGEGQWVPQKTVVEEETNNVTTGRGGTNTNNEGQQYSKELRSRFGEAFLPFASKKLESVEKERTPQKRKGKTRRSNQQE